MNCAADRRHADGELELLSGFNRPLSASGQLQTSRAHLNWSAKCQKRTWKALFSRLFSRCAVAVGLLAKLLFGGKIPHKLAVLLSASIERL